MYDGQLWWLFSCSLRNLILHCFIGLSFGSKFCKKLFDCLRQIQRKVETAVFIHSSQRERKKARAHIQRDALFVLAEMSAGTHNGAAPAHLLCAYWFVKVWFRVFLFYLYNLPLSDLFFERWKKVNFRFCRRWTEMLLYCLQNFVLLWN